MHGAEECDAGGSAPWRVAEWLGTPSMAHATLYTPPVGHRFARLHGVGPRGASASQPIVLDAETRADSWFTGDLDLSLPAAGRASDTDAVPPLRALLLVRLRRQEDRWEDRTLCSGQQAFFVD